MSAPPVVTDKLEIRACSGFAELDACVQLQIDTWGYDALDVVPRKLFVVAQRVGGQVIAAFEPNGNMAGYVLALPGVRHGEPYLHSHMLAVRPEFRNQGVGRRLKLAQRDEALTRGFRLIEWTFDPLEIKNSFFNIEKLGAIVRSYTQDFYGVSSARIQGGRPTDRLHAEWWLDSRRVRAAVAGQQAPRSSPEERILLPRQVMEWKESAEGAAQAMELQRANYGRFMAGFARGLSVTGFSRDKEGNGWFELSHWSEADELPAAVGVHSRAQAK